MQAEFEAAQLTVTVLLCQKTAGLWKRFRWKKEWMYGSISHFSWYTGIQVRKQFERGANLCCWRVAGKCLFIRDDGTGDCIEGPAMRLLKPTEPIS